MISQVKSLFYKKDVVKHIQQVLPDMFYKAEMECIRGGKVGMEVGCLRERQLVSMLMYFLSKSNVNEKVPTTEPEVDVKISGKPLAIRTSKNISSVKASWKVDALQAENFIATYKPKADLLFVHIQWDKVSIFGTPSLYHVPIEAAILVHFSFGKKYFTPPKQGTDAKGVEFSRAALRSLLNHPMTSTMDIDWVRPKYTHDPYHKWFQTWSAGHVHKKYLYYK